MVAGEFPIRNTLGVSSMATLGERVTSLTQLDVALQRCAAARLPWVALGAGSNIIPLKTVHAFVASIDIKGVQLDVERPDSVEVTVGAGENWHNWVQTSIARGWHGLENLVSIPGCVGAAPIQNIGAYGVEVSSRIMAVHCVDIDRQRLTIAAQDCDFGYRTSVFKQRQDLTVTAVTFRLNRQVIPVIEYPDVSAALNKANLSNPNAEQIAATIAAIRASKLPDPEQHANVGSFFKNPIVAKEIANELEDKLVDLKRYAAADSDHVKLSAAQLIDSLGWKKRPSEHVYCWPQQALVLVNRGASNSEEVLHFAEQIRHSVLTYYGVSLELEPSVLS